MLRVPVSRDAEARVPDVPCDNEEQLLNPRESLGADGPDGVLVRLIGASDRVNV